MRHYSGHLEINVLPPDMCVSEKSEEAGRKRNGVLKLFQERVPGAWCEVFDINLDSQGLVHKMRLLQRTNLSKL